MPVSHEWLRLLAESAIDPQLPIIDAHHHLWEVHPFFPAYRGQRYMEPELMGDMRAGHRFIGSVYVEVGQAYLAEGPEHLWPVGEAAWVDSLARRFGERDRFGLCAAMVGYADLSLGEGVDAVLAALCAAAPRRMRAVRNFTGWDGNPDVAALTHPAARGVLGDARFRKGYGRLARHGLHFEACLFHPQLPELVELARAYPDTQIVLNHLGTPLGVGPYGDDRDKTFRDWSRSIAELARCDNVSVKLGGLLMHLCGNSPMKRPPSPPSSDELAAITGRYHLHAIECFTPSRCMFESNFPVDKDRVSATVLWNSFKKISAGFSADERAELFHGTASRVYGFDPAEVAAWMTATDITAA
jgi:L-fuconolactonase